MTVIVLHSTEGATLEGAIATLRANNSASHEVWEIGGERAQLVALDQPARALVNKPGGVETNNRGGVIQVELVGFASRSSAAQALHVDEDKVPAGVTIMAELTDDQLRWLAAQLIDLCAQVHAPLTFPCTFLPYPSSYGANGVRLSFDAWLSVEGVIGHQHVPENDHGDPGAIDVARMVALTNLTPQPAEETDVQLSDTTTAGHTVNDLLEWTIDGVNKLNAAVAGIAAVVADIAQHVDAPQAQVAVDAAAVAKATAEELSKRLTA